MPSPAVAHILRYKVPALVAAGGGNDANTVLLLHGDGTNGSTTFADSALGGAAPHTMSVVNSGCQISTAQAKFGTASIAPDWAGGSNLFADGSSDFAFGTGDFTIDLWVYNLFGTDGYIYDGRPGGASSLSPFIIMSGGVLLYTVNAGTRITGTTPITANAWHHVALARSGSTTNMYLDGTQEGSSYATLDNLIAGSTAPGIGGPASGGNTWRGYLDEVRVSKGIARWTTGFTPPTVAYS